jgi:hypothetical protein
LTDPYGVQIQPAPLIVLLNATPSLPREEVPPSVAKSTLLPWIGRKPSTLVWVY